MTSIRQDTELGDTTQLSGFGLWCMRALWGAVIGLTFVIVFFSMPLIFSRFIESGREFQSALAQVGLTTAAYAVYRITLIALQFTAFSITAIALFWNKPDGWMSIFTSIVLITFGGYVSTGMTDVLIFLPPVLNRLAFVFWATSTMAFVVFIYIMPDGKFVPRWILPASIGWMSWGVLWGLFPESPFSLVTWPDMGAFLLFLGAYASGIAVQSYRERHHYTPLQKQQIKWITLSMLIAFLGGFVVNTWPLLMFPVLAESGVPGLLFRMIVGLVSVLSMTAIPVAITFSIQHYRLWDVDFVINRSLVYGGLTVILGLVFAGGFGVLHLVLERVMEGTQMGIAVGASAVLTVVMFTPARRRIRHFIDRRFYGIEIEYVTPPRRIQRVARSDLTHIGNYLNLELIGSGGMAEVYRGQHPTLNRTVAVKVLSVKLAEQEEARRRFNREVQVLAGLQHPNIVRLFDHGEADGLSYMVMEYIEGQDLADLIRASKRLPLEQVQRILVDIVAALDYAHAQGLVHRDIKPSNVMLQPATTADSKPFRAILTDFGIARLTSAVTQLTGTGGIVGTLDYIAPEQIQGASDVDGRADVYALGVMAYQMLAGQLPFRHNNPGATLMAHMLQPPPDVRDIVPELPESVAAAIIKAMAKKPEERFETAGAFMADLLNAPVVH